MADWQVPYDEAEAARRLGMSKASLIRERLAGHITPFRFGERIIRYTDDILEEYKQRCRNASAKSETTGSANGPGPSSGAGRGTTQLLDRQDAHRLLQRMLKKAS